MLVASVIFSLSYFSIVTGVQSVPIICKKGTILIRNAL